MRIAAVLAVCAVLAMGCGGGGDSGPIAPPATVTVTPTSTGPTLSAAEQALEDAACNNYPKTVAQSIQENHRLRNGHTDFVILMSSTWGGDAEDVDELEAFLERLLAYHASLGTSARGWLSALVSLPAESIAQAASTAAAVVSQAIGADVVAVDAMTAEEFDARQGFVAVPDLVGATEAAELLGVSRQAVQQMASDGRLPSQMVGKSLVIPRGAVAALVERRAQGERVSVPAVSPCEKGGDHDWDPRPLQLNILAEDRSLIPDPSDDIEHHECRRCGNVASWPKGAAAPTS